MSGIQLSLIVAWRSKPDLQAGPVDIAGDVVGEFQKLLFETEAELEARGEPSQFDLDAEYEPESRQLVRAGHHEIIDTSLIQLVLRAHGEEYVTGDALRTRKPVFYAISAVIDGDRRAYVRAMSPVKFAGKTIRGRLTDSFDRITEPILVFDSSFDFVVTEDSVLILNPAAFERVTNSPEAARAASERLTTSLRESLPLAPAGLPALSEHLARNSFSRRKALSISNKAYLSELTAARISEALVSHDLHPNQYLIGNQILFTSENAKTLLALLNEDVFSGDFSGVEYAASRKSRLG